MKIKQWLKSAYTAVTAIAQDKLLHFIAGAIITMISTFVIGILTTDSCALVMGLLIGCTAGLVKEVLDSTDGDFDLYDLIYTCSGAATITLYTWVVRWVM